MTLEGDNKKDLYVVGDHKGHKEDARRLGNQAGPQNIETDIFLSKNFEEGSIKQVNEFFAGDGSVLGSIAHLVDDPRTSLIIANDDSPVKIDAFTENANKFGFFNIKKLPGKIQDVINEDEIQDNALNGLTHIRLGLVFVPKPRPLIEQLAGKMAPNSYLLLEELDAQTWKMSPNSPDFEKLADAYTAFRDNHGLSNRTGSELYKQCKKAGLKIVSVDNYQTISTSKDKHHLAVANFLKLALPQVVFDNLLKQGEAEDALDQYIKDLETAEMAYPLMTQVLAVKK